MSKTLKIRRHIPSVFQQNLDFSGGRTISLSIEHPAESILFRFFVGLIVLLLLGYLYFVYMSILNVIVRREALTGIARTQNNISAMEREHFILSQSVTASAGVSLGLSPIKSTSYVYRPGNTVAATIQGNAI